MLNVLRAKLLDGGHGYTEPLISMADRFLKWKVRAGDLIKVAKPAPGLPLRRRHDGHNHLPARPGHHSEV
jgi:hypothetical protein